MGVHPFACTGPLDGVVSGSGDDITELFFMAIKKLASEP